MSELPLPSFPPPAGLSMVGDDAAGFCADGVCEVPGGSLPAEPAAADHRAED